MQSVAKLHVRLVKLLTVDCHTLNKLVLGLTYSLGVLVEQETCLLTNITFPQEHLITGLNHPSTLLNCEGFLITIIFSNKTCFESCVQHNTCHWCDHSASVV